MIDLILDYMPWILAILILSLLFSPTRSIIAWIITGLLVPLLGALIRHVSLWLLWMNKRLIANHFLIFKNMNTPHSIIHPTLAKRKNEKGGRRPSRE